MHSSPITLAPSAAAYRHALWASTLLGLSLGASAQALNAPSGGLLLQENRPAPALPPAAPALPASPEAASPDTAAPAAGPRVVLREVRVQEVPGVDLVQLRAATGLDQAAGQSLDLAGLRALADRVTAYLHDRGFLLARAWLPEQNLGDGALQINILEGRYGQVQAQGSDGAMAASAQRWLAGLQPGQVITQEALHRSLLLLSDLPGMSTRSVLRPGAELGESDLLLEIEPTARWSGRIGMDNFGNRYAGRERLTAGLDVQPQWVFGDRASVELLGTREKTWQAAASYSLPLGTDGWRLQTQLSRIDYQLGKEFSALGAHGTADSVQWALGYPLLRTRDLNLRTSLGWQHRSLKDVRDAVPSADRKSLHSAQLSLAADWLQPHAMTWGVLALHAGKLRLSAAQHSIDERTARTAGRNQRLQLDAARLHALTGQWRAYGRVSAQWASKNLDDSEKMVLGGASGVRAWPTGEAVGDQGWLAQLELRWQALPAWQPYVFVDTGSVRLNHAPWTNENNRRSIAGRGLGVRYEALPVKLDLAWARRNGSAASRADPSSSRHRIWLSASYLF